MVESRVAVFGLGHVGLVNALGLAAHGHRVTGVEIDRRKLELLRGGRSPIREPRIDELLGEQLAAGRFTLAGSPRRAVAGSDATLVCVGTPSGERDAVDLTQIEAAADEIGAALGAGDGAHLVVIRSTVPPGTTRTVSERLASAAGRRLGAELLTAFNPEFLRGGSAVADFHSPPFTIVGTDQPRAAEAVLELFGFLEAPSLVVQPEEAELLKYASNAFHAAKVVFANEIGRIARSLDLDGGRVMELLCQDHVLNVSAAYLRPGQAYGGPCLPKDLAALVELAAGRGLEVPMLEGLRRSNERQIGDAHELLRQAVRRSPGRVGFLGLAFKSGTGETRGSVPVELARRLLADGEEVLFWDSQVEPEQLDGAGPGLGRRRAESASDLVRRSGVVVVGDRRAWVDVLSRGIRHDEVVDLDAALAGDASLGEMDGLPVRTAVKRQVT